MWLISSNIRHSPFPIWASFSRSDFFVGSDPKAKRPIGQFNLIFNFIFGHFSGNVRWIFYLAWAVWNGTAISHRNRQKLLCCPCFLQTTNNLSFFLVRRAKRARHENDNTHDWRRETGEARFLLWLLPSFLVSRGTRERAGTPVTKSKEKETARNYYFLKSLGSNEQ